MTRGVLNHEISLYRGDARLQTPFSVHFAVFDIIRPGKTSSTESDSGRDG